MANAKDKLYRSQTSKILGGVCGGIGQHYSLDPLIIRILWVVAVFSPARGLALLGYILCWLLIPREPSGWRAEADLAPGASQRGVFLGVALVIIGIMALLATTIGVGWPVLFAIAMIIIGALIALGAFPNGFSHHKEG